MIGQQAAVILAEAIGDGEDDADQTDEVQQANADAQCGAAPMAGDPPDGAIPEALRQKQDCHE